MKENRFKVTISGSFRKHLKTVIAVVTEFANLNVEVLSPVCTAPKNPNDEFILFHGQDTDDPRELENRHLQAIEKSDFLYLVDPAGYLGKSATLEMGYALSRGKPIFTLEPINDFTLKLFCQGSGRPKQILRTYRRLSKPPLRQLVARPTLADLQEYLRQVAVERGFGGEPPQEIILFLVAKIGELAKSIGLKPDPKKDDRCQPIEGKLADCLIRLLDLANRLEVDFERAFRLRESENERRFLEKQRTKP